ncbi:MAG: hypothetical protein EZS28_051154 [Streblomastix strix]|uniref:Uncharacterized protein n=1 Tax=Streblomastix strix TaxID=222440 RepID=A0A5J4T4J0_9EUKA|nr:MAG: hypothetical protein EZS28_051154 [Streblomastix strix]
MAQSPTIHLVRYNQRCTKTKLLFEGGGSGVGGSWNFYYESVRSFGVSIYDLVSGCINESGNGVMGRKVLIFGANRDVNQVF